MAYDVITGSASFSGLTLDEAQSATAVFRDAIARVAGVDIDRVTILGIEVSAAPPHGDYCCRIRGPLDD